MKRTFLLFLTLFLLIQTAFCKEERIAIIGDSIAYAGEWATFVTEALHQKPEFADAVIANISVPSETVCGLSEVGHAGGAFPHPSLHDRLGRVTSQFKPTIMLVCYGVNDGLSMPLSEKTLEAFKMGIERVKSEAEATGTRVIFITPPPFKLDQEEKNGQHVYDKTLDGFSEWLLSQTSKGYQVIDIRSYVKKAFAKAKKANPQLIYSQDGAHPGMEGHQMIAEAVCIGLSKFLKTPEKPKFPTGEAFVQARQKQEQLRNEWLSKTMHKRPQIPGYHAIIPYFQAPGTRVSKWNQFERHDFDFEGKKATIIFPERPLPGNPWLWRPQFFEHNPIVDISLVGKGFTLAYLDMPDMYGSPKALETMTKFYDYVTANHALSHRPILEAFGSGSLYAFRWAALHPKWVSGIVATDPVCDIKSWPAGKGKGKASPEDWKKLLAAYGMTEKQALALKANPIDVLTPLAKAKIPVLIIARKNDKIVPFEENAKILAARYQKRGGSVKSIFLSGNHMDQTTPDITPIEDFIFAATNYQRPVAIMCIGDSITEGCGVNPHQRWTRLLSEKIGQNYMICNQGITMRTLLSKGNFPYIKEQMYKNALNSKSDIALIALGTNDSKTSHWKFKNEFAKDYKAIIDDLRKSNPKIEIYCLKPIPSSDTVDIQGPTIEKEVAPMIDQIAKDNKCQVIDLFGAMKNHMDMLKDKVHPNPAGHAVMADAIYKAVIAPRKM